MLKNIISKFPAPMIQNILIGNSEVLVYYRYWDALLRCEPFKPIWLTWLTRFPWGWIIVNVAQVTRWYNQCCTVQAARREYGDDHHQRDQPRGGQGRDWREPRPLQVSIILLVKIKKLYGDNLILKLKLLLKMKIINI